MGISSLVLCAKAAYVIQWAAFIPSALGKTERFFDLTRSLTFLAMLGIGFTAAFWNGHIALRQFLVDGAVAIWTLRLGAYLFIRMQYAGKDNRFDAVRDRPFKFIKAWTLQGLVAFVMALPALIVLTTKDKQPSLGLTDFLGLGLWAVGLTIEAIADQQKFAYRTKNADHWVDVGLWRTARHPNYFGEIVLWFGILLMASKAIHGAQWLAVLSPLSVILMVTKLTGAQPLEEMAGEKWGGNPAFQKYMQNTNLLMPTPWRSY